MHDRIPATDARFDYDARLVGEILEITDQGQLINFIFCFGLPIPASWERQWALRHEG
jgi:hypothetical protein